jgi:hypothetical protein
VRIKDSNTHLLFSLHVAGDFCWARKALPTARDLKDIMDLMGCTEDEAKGHWEGLKPEPEHTAASNFLRQALLLRQSILMYGQIRPIVLAHAGDGLNIVEGRLLGWALKSINPEQKATILILDTNQVLLTKFDFQITKGWSKETNAIEANITLVPA